MAKFQAALLRHLHAVTLGLVTVAGSTGLLAGCAPAPQAPRDVGSMAFPAPVQQGQLGVTSPGRITDTGSMAYPAPVPQGQVGTTVLRSAPRDVGSMAIPAPTTTGTSTTTRGY